MKWIDKEPGPECYCGAPTFVALFENGDAALICIFHEYEAGASFPLPKEKPEKWPNMTNEEMAELVDKGIKEQETED